MNTLLTLFFIVGFIFLLSFIIGCIFIYRNNISKRLKTNYSIFLTLCIFIYLISVFLIFIDAIFTKRVNYYFYIIFAFLPFIIGKLSSYKTLRFYVFLQTMAILSGCIISFVNLIN